MMYDADVCGLIPTTRLKRIFEWGFKQAPDSECSAAVWTLRKPNIFRRNPKVDSLRKAVLFRRACFWSLYFVRCVEALQAATCAKCQAWSYFTQTASVARILNWRGPYLRATFRKWPWRSCRARGVHANFNQSLKGPHWCSRDQGSARCCSEEPQWRAWMPCWIFSPRSCPVEADLQIPPSELRRFFLRNCHNWASHCSVLFWSGWATITELAGWKRRLQTACAVQARLWGLPGNHGLRRAAKSTAKPTEPGGNWKLVFSSVAADLLTVREAVKIVQKTWSSLASEGDWKLEWQLRKTPQNIITYWSFIGRKHIDFLDGKKWKSSCSSAGRYAHTSAERTSSYHSLRCPGLQCRPENSEPPIHLQALSNLRLLALFQGKVEATSPSSDLKLLDCTDWHRNCCCPLDLQSLAGCVSNSTGSCCFFIGLEPFPPRGKTVHSDIIRSKVRFAVLKNIWVVYWWILLVLVVDDDGLLDHVQVLHQFTFVALNSRWPQVLIWNYCFCKCHRAC